MEPIIYFISSTTSDFLRSRNVRKNGLYPKYNVIDAETGEEIKECFVMVPATDWRAALAVMFYGWLIQYQNPDLFTDLWGWIRGLFTTYNNEMQRDVYANYSPFMHMLRQHGQWRGIELME